MIVTCLCSFNNLHIVYRQRIDMVHSYFVKRMNGMVLMFIML